MRSCPRITFDMCGAAKSAADYSGAAPGSLNVRRSNAAPVPREIMKLQMGCHSLPVQPISAHKLAIDE
jgi:hypothetical protein